MALHFGILGALINFDVDLTSLVEVNRLASAVFEPRQDRKIPWSAGGPLQF
jgi:hypothetical protein